MNKTSTKVSSMTAAQRRILTAAAAHKSGRVVGGDPRTREALISRGWIRVDGHHYGPLFSITDGGRRALSLGRAKVGS